MPKRKRELSENPRRKSASLAEQSQRSSPCARIQTAKEPHENGARVLPSPSVSSPGSRYLHRSLDGLTKDLTNGPNHKSRSAKSLSHELNPATKCKRKLEKPQLQPEKRAKASEANQPSQEQNDQGTKDIHETRTPARESPTDLRNPPNISEADDSFSHIRHWLAYGTWPKEFEQLNMMTSASANKRQRTSSAQSVNRNRPPSYSQSRKDGTVPEQYTYEYERHIFTKGLDMDLLRGESYISKQSQKSCISFMKITRHSITPTIFPYGHLRKVINQLANRNEAIITRDVSPMILPPIMALTLSGATHLEHVVDEVDADWYEQCVLEGPRIRPDRAIGLFSTAFTQGEIDKLTILKSVDNWTQFTGSMYFPFLMMEVECEREGLDVADRQNMHSCCVAINAILRLEQKADRYRTESELEKLSGQVLVYSISHDRQDLRLYGHFAIIQGQGWIYHRYRIGTFNLLTSEKDLLTVYNSVQNILKIHLPDHVKRIKNALSVQPDPCTLSFSALGISLSDDSQQASRDLDADGFAVPPMPSAAQAGENATTRKQNKALLETSNAFYKKELDLLKEQMEQQTRLKGADGAIETG